MIVYKVTDENGYSFIISRFSNFKRIDKNFNLKYEIGKITRPKIGAVFAFKRLKDAREFVIRDTNPYNPYKIYKCDAKKAAYRRYRIDLDYFSVGTVIEYWHHYIGFLKESAMKEIPLLMPMQSNTVLCDWVMPMELVEEG